MIVYRNFRIHASRFLPKLSDEHICKKMHGHTFNIKIFLDGPIDNKSGFVMDFYELDKIINKEIISLIDHKVLNDIDGLQNPSSELLSIFIWDKLKDKLKYLHKVSVSEDYGTGVEYSGE